MQSIWKTTLFLTATVLMTAAGVARPVGAQTPEAKDAELFSQDAVILFQGDSITDGGRGRGDDPNHIHGHCYAYLIASYLGANFPERNWTFYNRGVSGDTVDLLIKRWNHENETIALAPNVLSILIGTNDCEFGKKSPEQFEKEYDALLAETVQKLPNTRLVLISPFNLREGGREKIAPFREATQRMAEKYHAILVPNLQEEFERRTVAGPNPKYWIWDGIHPTTMGHWIIFQEWMKAVRP